MNQRISLSLSHPILMEVDRNKAVGDGEVFLFGSEVADLEGDDDLRLAT